MAQKVTGIIKLQINAAKATASPPVGPALGQHGVNIAAFIKEFNARTQDQAGFKVPVVNPDWSAPATSLNSAQTHALKGYGLNMWIWVSDATKVGGTFVARFCEEGKNTSGLGNWTYQFTSAQSGTAGYKISWQTGWNNVTFWLPDTGDFDHRTNMNSDGKTITEVIFEDHTTTGTYSFAVACARLVKGQAEAEAGWGIGSGTGDAVDVAMIVVAILLAAMAASVTVYFGKKAR